MSRMLPSGEHTLRVMRESDLDAVLVIEQASFSSPWKRDHFIHEITAPHSTPLVAECSGAISGYLCLTALFEEAQILDIAVLPEQRGRGVARLLLEYAFSLAREKGAEFVSLEVRETNEAALYLYERLGFLRTGRRTRYYEAMNDAVLMEKIL